MRRIKESDGYVLEDSTYLVETPDGTIVADDHTGISLTWEGAIDMAVKLKGEIIERRTITVVNTTRWEV